MHRRTVFSLATFVALLALALVYSAPQAEAQGPLPGNDRARGLIYDGLERGNDNECKNAFKVQGRGNAKSRCTHGPDAPPTRYNIAQSVTPLPSSSLAPSGIICDGDGESGARVQVLYARASDVADRYAAYLPSFQQWTTGIEAIYSASAAQTNGTRHVRFVHDANCNPVIPSVVLSPFGDDNLVNTLNEIEALGYNRHDRKYVIFMDAHVYCGIGLIAYDDLWSGYNDNNDGDTFGRIDAGCWSDVIAAHELMHQMGGVQMSAPHSSGESHCFDGWDLMCRPTNGTTLQVVCADTTQNNLFDCNHDDYFSTDAAVGSYLNTRWNAATSQFLIVPAASRVASLVTLDEAKKKLTAADGFKRGDRVYLQAQVVNHYNFNLANVDVVLTVNQPDGSVLCTMATKTDSAGIAQATCALTGKFTLGTFTARVASFNLVGYPSDMAHSVLTRSFVVR